MRGERWFVEIMGAGAALLDYDDDGDLDLFLVQGGSLDPEARASEPGDRLHRNDLDAAGAPRFVDVTAAAAVVESGYGMGAATGDYDGDGWIDLYVTNWGANELWRNRGDGSFERRGEAAGVDDTHWGVPAIFFDADRDGRLDLFVGNYVNFSAATHQRCMSALGVLDYCGPLTFTPQPDLLYRNAGDGTFTDVSGAAGLRAAAPLPALGAAVGDFDADGWLDLYVANDQTPNHLWRGLGGGRFEEVALGAGCALDAEGRPQASMGVTIGDGDGDGDEDLFLTHLTEEHHTLYTNDGRGFFEDASARAGVVAPSWPLTGFGVGWIDFDGDGQLDLLSTAGAVKLIPSQVAENDPLALRQACLLLRNTGGGRFAEVTQPADSPLAVETVGRGAAFGDVDNDGDTDVVLTANDGPVRLLLNQVGSRASWLGLRLVERTAGGRDRDVLGAGVTLRRTGAPALWRRVQTAGSYASASDPRVLFGLGGSDAIESVEVTWPDGTLEQWRELSPRRYHTLRRGEGQ
jgi:hypothetical protein